MERQSGQRKDLNEKNFFLGIRQDTIGLRKETDVNEYLPDACHTVCILNPIRYNYYIDF